MGSGSPDSGPSGWLTYNYDGGSYYTHDYSVYWQHVTSSGTWNFDKGAAWVSTNTLGEAPYDGGYGPWQTWFHEDSGTYQNWDVYIGPGIIYYSEDWDASGATFWSRTNAGAWSYMTEAHGIPPPAGRSNLWTCGSTDTVRIRVGRRTTPPYDCWYYTHDNTLYWQQMNVGGAWNFYNGTAWVSTDALGNAPYDGGGYGPPNEWFHATIGVYSGYDVYINTTGATTYFSLDHTAAGATYWQLTNAGAWSYYDGSAWYPTTGFDGEPMDVWFHGYDTDAGWDVYNYTVTGDEYFTHDMTVFWWHVVSTDTWQYFNGSAWVLTTGIGVMA